MKRLGTSTVLPPHVDRPGYDRSALSPGIVHLGIGAFHRAHQAVYTDAALAAEFGPWGIVGASLRSTGIVRDMRAQDGLYSVVMRDASGERARVVGAVVDTIATTEERERLLARLADPAVRIVTMTVSEKAYGIDPVTGGLDAGHPAVKADLAAPHTPTGVVGVLVEGLVRRRDAGVAPFTVLCCDNLPSNGRIVRRLVMEMAQRRDAALAAWIGREGRFPSSMVDRIVPAATDATRALAAGLIGAEDALAVEAETFSQWVIEDSFVAGRPAWEAGGALFVRDVEPYEKMKLRLLNGSHSLIAYLGQLYGYDTVRDVMAAPEHVAIVRRHMAAAAATFDPVPGVDLAVYREQLIARFANPAIAHRTAQIAMDGSQKLPQRIFMAAMDAIAAGGDADAFAYVTALWLAHIARAHELNDPRATELLAAARAPGASPSEAFLGVPGLFPSALVADARWRGRVDAHVTTLTEG